MCCVGVFGGSDVVSVMGRRKGGRREMKGMKWRILGCIWTGEMSGWVVGVERELGWISLNSF